MIEKIKELFNLKNVLKEELVEYIIIYLRKSRKDAEFGNDEPIEKTLERHESILQTWAQQTFGCKIPEKNIFREIVSGDTIAERPEIQKVLKLIENDNYKAVLCIEIERLARGNTIDQGTIVEKFDITNTKILTPGRIFDLNDEYDMSYFEDGLHQARKYLNYTKRILTRGRVQSVNEGKCPISTPPFGYDKEKLQNEKGFTLKFNDDITTVRKIFDMYLYENLGANKITRKLNELGLKSPSGEKWTPAMVRTRLYRAETYAGYVTWEKRKNVKKYVNGKIINTRPISPNYIVKKGKHPAIITDEELNMLKEKSKANTPQNPINNLELQNPISGIVKCAFCGLNMKRRPYNKKGQRASLICTTQGCPNVATPLEVVENSIIEFLKETLHNYEKILSGYTYENEIKKENLQAEKKMLNKKLNTINLQKQKCCEYLETGTYDEETFRTRIKTLNQEIENINESINTINKKIEDETEEKYISAVPILKQFSNLYNQGTIKQKNELLNNIIDVIYYKKTNNNGRWDSEAIYDFNLEIKLKI
ncbi:MAG: recombinase family protein [Bacilli bacterium]|nr:recombinase family protein [Bacilli bacterium]